MKKKLSFLIITLICISFTGCFVKELPINDNEREIIAQYAADAILRHDKHYSSMLLTEEQVAQLSVTATPRVTATPTAEPTEAPENNQPAENATPTVTPAATGNENNNDVTPTEKPVPTEKPAPTFTPTPTPFPEHTEFTDMELTQVIGAWDGLFARYIKTSLPEKEVIINDAATALVRDPGYEYIVCRFDIANENDEVAYLSTYQQELKCILMYNNGETKNAEMSFLPFDLRHIGEPKNDEDWSFGEAIKPGEVFTAALAFKIPEGTEFETAAIAITNKDAESVIIKIK